MAIRRISELDKISAVYPENFVDPDTNMISAELSTYLLETSEWSGENNEANSYYLSKQFDMKTLSCILNNDINQRVQQFEDKITALADTVNNLSQYIDSISSIINKWYTNYLDLSSISCTNLTVENVIEGTAMHALWS